MNENYETLVSDFLAVISVSEYMGEVKYSCRLLTFYLKLKRRLKYINKGYNIKHSLDIGYWI